MRGKNGYSMIEVLVASTIFFQVILIFIPIHSQLQMATDTLSDKRWASIILHEEIQHFIWEDAPLLPATFETELKNRVFSLHFYEEEGYVKGCVYWINAKKTTESFCLYGLPYK
ncbi:hypothetical protein M3210_00545 [Oceanobacillus luteolus]|uniref:Prepilin-type N-terminal cleavage/methylation domain-containing protein n=1 Tax=Oceanobacillus luteolus TaxID=1274358 RepID=A0ABW4HWG5_9BACI|nr:hypothetical protein [Oceanobacillus luteolus]MCM3738742.1 hypothetical protein [Oceanobacillus luteolus]